MARMVSVRIELELHEQLEDSPAAMAAARAQLAAVAREALEVHPHVGQVLHAGTVLRAERGPR